MVTKEEILEKGWVEVHVKVGGIRQRHRLNVEKEKTVWGMVPFCVFSFQVPAAELVRIAEELQLPVKCKGMKVFPKGKAAQDFAQKDEPKKRKGLAHDRVVGSGSSVPGTEEEKGEEGEQEETEEDEENEEGQEPVEDSEPDGKAEEPEEEEEEGGEEKTPEGEEGPPKPKPQEEEDIEIEGSVEEKENQSGERQEEKPKKKIFGGVLSEGLLS